MALKFYVCKHCGNIVTYVKNAGVPVMCCGEKMSEIVSGTSDGAHEKHVPAVSVEGQKVAVKVGGSLDPVDCSRDKAGQPDQISESGREAGGRVCSQRRRRGSGCIRVLQPSRTLEEGNLSLCSVTQADCRG